MRDLEGMASFIFAYALIRRERRKKRRKSYGETMIGMQHTGSL